MFFNLAFNISHVSASVPAKEMQLATDFMYFTNKEVVNIIKTTKVEKIRIADKNTYSSDLCLHAAQNIFLKNPNLKENINAIVFVSQTPDYGMPNTSFQIQKRLGLSDEVFCIDLQYGCSGYIYGLLQCAQLLKNENIHQVLLLVGETNSKMINNEDMQSSLIFGDAGTASIIEKSENNSFFNFKSFGEENPTLYRQYGGYKPIVNQKYSPEFLYMDGLEVFKFAITKVPTLITELLNKYELTISEIDTFIFHQANGFIINYISKALKIPLHKAPMNLQYFGNTGPASIPLLLADLGNKLKIQDLNRVILTGFGVGLSWATVLVSLNNTKFYSPRIYG